jgi:hypothetical protein
MLLVNLLAMFRINVSKLSPHFEWLGRNQPEHNDRHAYALRSRVFSHRSDFKVAP